jgi:hypothetical protein
MKRLVSLISHDRHANVLDRRVGAAALMLDQTEQMKGLRITGVNGQDLAAHPLRIGRASPALMRERRPEPSGDRRRRADWRTTLLAPPGLGAPLLSVHQTLIPQQDDAYPPCGNKCSFGES